MQEVELRPEILSLIHHVELNNSQWWDRVIQRFILVTVWFADSTKGLQPCQVHDNMKSNFRMEVGLEKVQGQIGTLLKSGELVQVENGNLKLLESSRRSFEQEIRLGEAIEQDAINEFTTLILQENISIDIVRAWELLNTLFIVPMIKRTGAGIYRLITGDYETLDSSSLEEFLRQFPEETRSQLVKVSENFFFSKNTNVRSYILRLLSTYFSIEATSLDERTIKRISQNSTLTPSFTVFVDTNFLFLLLDLDDSPINNAAFAFLDLINKVTSNVNVSLYVLPQTVDEASLVLRNKEDLYNGSRITPNLASAALKTGVRGLSRKFLLEAINYPSGLSAREHFSPYRKNLVEILKSKNIFVFNGDMCGYETRQDIVDDILCQEEFEKSKFGEKAKNYHRLEHDIVLWHLAKDLRPSRVDNPVAANSWVISIDNRLLGFDAYKRRSNDIAIPVCLHPTTFIQMLQFWVPRNEDFEEALFSSLRLPFICQDFDDITEQTTLRILKSISRYENAKDLSEETVTAILLNDALRKKMVNEPGVEEEVDLIKEALIEENNKALQKAREAEQKANKLSQEILGKDQKIIDLTINLEEKDRALLEKETVLTREKQSNQQLQEVVGDFQTRLTNIELAQIFRKRTDSYIFKWIVLPAFLIILLLIALKNFLPNLDQRLSSASIGITFFISVWIAYFRGKKEEAIHQQQWFLRFEKSGKWIISIIGAIILSITASAIYDFVKSMFIK